MNSADVTHLLRSIAVPSLRYHEIRSDERTRAAARGRSVAPGGVRRPRRVAPGSPWCVAVSAVARGAGCTTVAVNLAAALERAGWRMAGVAAETAAARVGGPRVPSAGYDGVVLDLSAIARSAWRALLAECDEVVVIVGADASVDAVGRAESLLAALRAPRRTFVLNAFDGRIPAHREAAAALRGALGARLHDVPIQADRAVPAATAARRSIADEDPASQAAADVEALAAAVAAHAEERGRGGGVF